MGASRECGGLVGVAQRARVFGGVRKVHEMSRECGRLFARTACARVPREVRGLVGGHAPRSARAGDAAASRRRCAALLSAAARPIRGA